LYESNIGFIKKMIPSGRRVNEAVKSLSLFTIRDNLFTLPGGGEGPPDAI
jgi:hypothetical protein